MSRQMAAGSPELRNTVPVIIGGTLRWLDDSALGFSPPGGKRPCVLVPAEQVLLIAVDLPLSSHRQRIEAVPYAVEGMLAEPLSQVHIVLGPQAGEKRYLAGIVGHGLMSEWSSLLTKAGLSHARVLPDVLALPRPEAGGWTVFASGQRALVRKADASGFAIGLAALATAWHLSGCPPIVSHGDPLPPQFMARESEMAAAPLESDPVTAGFDLRQGAYADPAFRASGFLRQAGWIVGLGAVVFCAITLADTIALNRLAEVRRDSARQLMTRVMPEVVPEEDIALQLARLLPSAGEDRRGRFLPLLSRIAGALDGEAEGLTVQSLTYDAVDGQLSLEVAAENLAALQRIEAAMVGAGLQTSSGVATAEGGAAEVSLVVTDEGGGS